MRNRFLESSKRQNRGQWNPPVLAFFLLGALLFETGCQPPGRVDPSIKQIQELQDKVADQGRIIAQKDEALKAQAQTIRELQAGGKGPSNQLVAADKIVLEGLSGGYDDNSDGKEEGVVLYLQVLDADGETIKSSGSASVKLYDLSRPEGQQLLLSTNFAPEQLKPLWYGRFMTAHYTLKFPYNDKFQPPSGGKLTAVVNFVELLTGRSFDIQQLISVKSSK